ncbi:Protein of unknown function DUF58 [Butyrivibrio proteoclasticus]|uniref:Uncharacterized protein n=1 Tax=Butyrivibrio proteoclasticus TaxID=43305 RepID=A0A1I5W326_9FIRM|nr:DUF58 domain-containing protein [Butyrivibrio proteoclasticus]SFQ14120.1 Protein of unknown function DUF58 [Butyrivibrio proteoclasticus]
MPIILIPIVIFALYHLEKWLFGNFWDKGLMARLDFVEEAVNEGEKAHLQEVITNRNFLPLHILQVSFQTDRGLTFSEETNSSVSDRVNVTDVFSLGLYEKITRKLELDCQKRGYFSILKTSLKASDLFSPDIRYNTFEQHTNLYVYPAPLSVSKTEVPFRQLMGDVLSKRFLYEDNFTFRGIRDYSKTDPQNMVNWKATAKTGNLKVNLHDHTSSQEVMFILNVDEPGILFERELLEDCIRLTMSLAGRFIEENVPVSLLTNGRDKVTGESIFIMAGASSLHMVSIKRALARIDLEKTLPNSMAELVEREVANVDIENTTFCYISTTRGDDSLKAAGFLAQKSGKLLWLCPLTKDMKQERPENLKIDFKVVIHE